METKKESDIKLFFLIFALIIVAIIAAYSYLYKPLMEEKDALLVENHGLETRLIELRNLATDKEETFKEGIVESRNSMQELMDKYSAGNTPEKSIMMVNKMEGDLGLRFPNLSFSKPITVNSVKMPMILEGETGAYSIGYYDVSLLKETLGTSYSCTYEQLKQLIDFVNSYPERMNISSISMAYNSETGGLMGDMTLNLYAVTGTDKKYVEPVISDLSMGETNIFE